MKNLKEYITEGIFDENIDKSIKDFSDMIQILVENRNETHTEKTD
jgi:hypothetical protein